MKKTLFYLYINFFILVSVYVAYPNEIEMLKPNLEVKEITPSSDYYGLETKWSVAQKMESDISAKVTYMDLEVFLAYGSHEAEKNDYSPQEKEERKKEILHLLEKYLVFKIILKHEENLDYTRISNWQVSFIDDGEKEYLPEKIEEGEAELTRGYTGPYYARTSWVYFSKYHDSNSEPVLTKDTRWISLKLSKELKAKELRWVFIQEEEERSPYYFYPYLKAFLVIVFVLLIFLVWITRPGKAQRNVKSM